MYKAVDIICILRISLVESIPDNLTYAAGSPSHPSIYEAWMQLIGSATKSIDIAAFYWTLRSSDVEFDDPSDWQVPASFRSVDITLLVLHAFFILLIYFRVLN